MKKYGKSWPKFARIEVEVLTIGVNADPNPRGVVGFVLSVTFRGGITLVVRW